MQRTIRLVCLVCALAAAAVADEQKTPYDPSQPVQLADAAGGDWDLDFVGGVQYGTERRTFNMAFRLNVNGSDSYHQIQQAYYLARRGGTSIHAKLGSGGIEIGPVKLPGSIWLTRRVERTPSGFIRFTTILHNRGAAAQRVALYTHHGFNTSVDEPVRHRGRGGFGRGPVAWCFGQQQQRRSLLLVVSASDKTAVGVIRRSSNYGRVNWPALELPAGERRALVSFALQIRAAGEAATWLKKFRGSRELRGLPRELRKALVNFRGDDELAGLEIPRDEGADLVLLDDERSLRGKVVLGKLTLQGVARKQQVEQSALWGIARAERPGRFRVGWCNGQVLVGAIESGPLVLNLLGGQSLLIPWARVRSVAFHAAKLVQPPASARLVQLTTGDRLIVKALARPLVLHTRLGPLRLELEQLRRLVTLEEGNWGHRVWLAGGSRLGCLVAGEKLSAVLVSGETVELALDRLLAVLPTREEDDPLPEPGEFVLRLRNGDRLAGRIGAEKLALDSEFGSLEIAWRQIKQLSLQGAAREAAVVLFDGNLLRGHLNLQRIPVQLGPHAISVPLVLLERAEQLRQGLPAGLRKQVAALVKALDAPSFKVREKAQQALVALGPAVKPYLEKLLLSGEMSAEQKQRVTAILGKLK